MAPRATLAVTLLSILVACATAPVSFHGTIPPGEADSYACAMQQLNLLGYTVEDADRDAGFIRGRKQTSGLGTALLIGKNYHDLLTVAVFEDPTTTETTMRVTAARIEENAVGIFGGNEKGIAPSDSGKADANELLARCGVDDVIDPSGRREDYWNPIEPNERGGRKIAAAVLAAFRAPRFDVGGAVTWQGTAGSEATTPSHRDMAAARWSP